MKSHFSVFAESVRCLRDWTIGCSGASATPEPELLLQMLSADGHNNRSCDQPIQDYSYYFDVKVCKGKYFAFRSTIPSTFKGIYSCPIEVISGITNKGQFQYLNGFKGPQGGNYLYETKNFSLG